MSTGITGCVRHQKLDRQYCRPALGQLGIGCMTDKDLAVQQRASTVNSIAERLRFVADDNG